MILLTTDSVSVKASTRGGGDMEIMSPSLGKFSFLLTEVNIFLAVDGDVDMWLSDGLWM